MTSAKDLQSKYYSDTAEKYDDWHIDNEIKTGHRFALYTLCSIIELHNIQSILDVGAGTGRTVLFLKKKYPKLRIIGIEPVDEMREVGFRKGIPDTDLIKGSGYNLDFEDDSFDLVCEFGVLHHVDKPDLFIDEMIRCSRRIVFISDVNTVGQGSVFMRRLKLTLKVMGLWRVFIWIKTKGKMYSISKGDGLFYSYSVFDNLKVLQNASHFVHIMNSKGKPKNLFREAESLVVIAALKK